MKSKFLFSLLVSFCLFSTTVSSMAQDEKFKAIFIYNFTKYINWPASDGDFVINILGDDNIIKELANIATKKTVGNSNIIVKKILGPQEINVCHILYIAGGKSDFLSEIFQIAKKKNILVITEKSNSCRSGACINFLSKDGKLTFEISKTNIELCGLEVSSNLLNLGQAAGN
jgi:hypothetical protein